MIASSILVSAINLHRNLVSHGTTTPLRGQMSWTMGDIESPDCTSVLFIHIGSGKGEKVKATKNKQKVFSRHPPRIRTKINK